MATCPLAKRFQTRSGIARREALLRAGAVLIAGAAVALGCAGLSGPDPRRLPFVPEALRAGLGTIGVSSAAAVTPDQIDVPPGYGESVLRGVLGGAHEGLMIGRGRDEFDLLLGVVVMPFSAVAGGVDGARGALPSEALEASAAAIARAILEARTEPSLADRIYQYARDTVGERIAPRADTAPSSAPDIDTRLEIGDAIVRLEGGGFTSTDPLLRLRIESRVRLLRAADGAELVSFVRSWGAGDSLRIREWAEQDARRVREAIEWMRQLLAEKIVEHLLLVYHDERTRVPEDRRVRVGNDWLADFPPLPPSGRLIWGLAPLHPPSERIPVVIDTLRPTFVWEPFPGRVEIPGDASAPPTAVPFVPVDLARVDHVTYEIQLRDDSGVGYPRLVYRRRGLAEPRHTIEEPLRPGTTYRWALRAWFELDGETRVSEWSRSLYAGPGGMVLSSGWRGYFFKTGS